LEQFGFGELLGEAKLAILKVRFRFLELDVLLFSP
jgi:hypothetical protein